MRSSNNERQLGDKLIPKLQAAIVESIVGTKKELLGTEHLLKMITMKATADMVGEELAELMEPLVTEALKDSTAPPEILDIVRKVASGENQFQAIAGIAFGLSGVPNVVAAFMNNAFAPIVRRLLADAPEQEPPWQVVVDLAARGLVTTNQMDESIAGSGVQNRWQFPLLQAAQSIPDFATITEFLRRSLMDRDNAKAWLNRAAIPPELWNQYIDLTRAVLAPADAALGVLRGDIGLNYAREIANANGITDDDFNILIANTGEPPGAMQLLEGYRRKFIDKATLELGIRQSRVRDQWIPLIEQLRYEPLSTADAIEASVQGYITKAQAKEYADQNGLEPADFDAAWLAAGEPLSRTEMMQLWRRKFVTEVDVKNAIRQSRTKDAYVDWAVLLKDAPMSTADAVEAYVQGYLSLATAKDIIEQNGLRVQDIDPLINTAGDPLSKTEVLHLLRLGKMSVDQVKQALRESRLKDKYIDVALDLQVTLPALYEVRTLLAAGALTAEQGTQLLLEQGYQEDIVKAIVKSETGTTIAKVKVITEAQITALYEEQEIDAATYINELGAVGYDTTEAELIKEVADWRLSITARNAVITKVRTQYIAGKINEQKAVADLDAVQISAAMRDKLIADWNLEKLSTVRLLSESQIVDLWQLGLFEENDLAANTQLALNYLVVLGYTQDDAILLLELKNKGPLGAPNAAQPVSPKSTGGKT